MSTPSPWDHRPRELAHALFQEVGDAVLLIDAATHHVLDANPAAAKLTGASRESLIGSDANDLLESDGPLPSAPVVQRARDTSGRATFRLRTATDGRIPVGVTAPDAPDIAPLVLLVLRDLRASSEVEQAERAEEARQQSEDRYRNMVEGSLQGVLIHQDARIRYANPALARMFGYDSADELVGRHLWETFVLPENRPMLLKRTEAILAGEAVPPHPGWRAAGKDGRTIWVATAASRVEWDGRPAVVSFYLDITERKRAEQALEASERFVRAITTASPHTMYVFDRVEGRNIWANRQIADDLGYTPEQVRDMGAAFPAALLHPDDLARLPTLLARWDTATDDDVLETEYRMRHADGTWRWFVGHDAVFSRAPDGRVRQFIGTAQDTTARKRTEDERRQSEARLASVIANSPGMAIQWYDGAGRVVLWNRASEEMFGYAAAEALGQTLDQLILTPEEFAVFREKCAAIVRTGESIAPTEFAFRRRSGEAGMCLSTLFRIPGPDASDWFVCMDIDITGRQRAEEDRRKLEARVLQAQKMESLGILAGGIAHDFNNLLTSVLGYASLAAMDLPPDSAPRQMVGEIEKAAQRAAELTKQMLAYSGRGKFVVQVLELDGLVREMNNLLQTVVSKKAEFHLELAPATIEADATQVRQVVMNLITNASDALGGRSGAITIRTGTRHMDADALRSPYLHESLPAGEYAYLEVADSGCGMTEDTLNKIFDPFFTTKFTGRGLGLAAVLGIVRGHRGSLQITTAPGAGATFRVCFPSVASRVVESAAIPPADAPRGHGSVLVVDDEDGVREYARHVLELAGFRVLLAKDGIEAVAAVREHGRALRVVVLDLTMPRMDGWEVASQLHTQDAGLPVLLMSGYSEPEMTAHAGRTNVAGFLQKPFRPDDLLDRVYRLARDAR